jgi:hypothetical protein
MHYKIPLPAVKFPFRYGEMLETASVSENLFSSLVPMYTHGDYRLEADACGMLVLPAGDTLKQVLRTRSVQTQYADSVRAMDSIYVDTAIETHRFWARGYRYPVFETVKTIHRRPAGASEQAADTLNVENAATPLSIKREADGELVSDTFTTAFFFPPPQQYSDSPDTANLAELARMEAETAAGQSLTEGGLDSFWAGMYYNVTPNPTRGNVLFEIFLPRAAGSLQLKVSNQTGLPMISQNRGAFPAGLSSFTLNMGALPMGNYILDFWLDGYLVHGGVIMKR